MSGPGGRLIDPTGPGSILFARSSVKPAAAWMCGWQTSSWPALRCSAHPLGKDDLPVKDIAHWFFSNLLRTKTLYSQLESSHSGLKSSFFVILFCVYCHYDSFIQFAKNDVTWLRNSPKCLGYGIRHQIAETENMMTITKANCRTQTKTNGFCGDSPTPRWRTGCWVALKEKASGAPERFSLKVKADEKGECLRKIPKEKFEKKVEMSLKKIGVWCFEHKWSFCLYLYNNFETLGLSNQSWVLNVFSHVRP